MKRGDWTHIGIAVSLATYLCFIIASEAWPDATIPLAIVAISAVTLLAVSIIYGVVVDARDRERVRRGAKNAETGRKNIRTQVRDGFRKGVSDDS